MAGLVPLVPLARGVLAPRLGTPLRSYLGAREIVQKQPCRQAPVEKKISDYSAIETGLIPSLVVVELVQRFWCAEQRAGRILVRRAEFWR